MLELTKQSRIQLYVVIVLHTGLILPVLSQVPIVTATQMEYFVNQGAAVTIGCKVQSSITVTTVFWQRNVGGFITTINVAGNPNKYSGGSPTTPSLTIANAANDDSGIYTCFAANAFGTGSSSQSDLFVILPNAPTITVSQGSYSVQTGNSVTLGCSVSSATTVTDVNWQRTVGSTVTVIRSITNVNKYQGASVGTPSLTILNADSGDSGNYVCYAVNAVGTTRSPTTSLCVKSNRTPSLTLNPDQVIDLVFPGGNFYRVDRTHKCVGDTNTGYPYSNLQIDITYDNGTSYQQIPADKFREVRRTNVSSFCSTTETLEFAVQFTTDMHKKAKLRCYFSGDNTMMTLSGELLLIPRNICSCGESGYKRGHPDNCHIYVECRKDSSGIYPMGVACPESQCRLSDTGECTKNCSSAVCDEKPDDDFCLPTPAPTTEEPPSPYATCQDKTIEIDTGPATITCTINGTAFTSLNITRRSSAGGRSTVIAQIDSINGATDLYPDDDISVNLDRQIISIMINTPSCTTGDFYGVDVIVDRSIVGSSSGKLIVGRKPTESPVMYLHPDQISGLGTYHSWLLHSCDADVGFPAGDIFVEILKDNDNAFVPLTVHVERSNSSQIDYCKFRNKVEFGIVFTSDMDNAIIRCGVRNDQLRNFTEVYSNNATISLISSTFCDINSSGGTVFYPHPSDCHSFIQCEGTSTSGRPCITNLCFGVESVNSCFFCDQVNCPSDVTTTMSTKVKTTTDTELVEKEGVPTVTVAQPSYTATTGQSVTLGCTVTSALSVNTVYWQINVDGTITTIQSNSNTNKYTGGTVATPSLTIFNAAQNDVGSYTCFATSSVGTGKSTVTNLSVTESLTLDLPNVTVAQPSYIVMSGQSVTLVCTVTSNLTITDVYWQKNVGGTITIFQSLSNINKYSGSTITTPSLTIFDAAQSDAGSYTCFASNSAGVGQSLTTSLSVTGGYQPQNDNSSTITTAVISVLATALAVLVIVIIICCLKRTNARKSERPETYEIQTSQRDHHYYDSTDVYDRIQGPEAIQNEVSFISIPDNRGSSPDYRESEEEHRYLELI